MDTPNKLRNGSTFNGHNVSRLPSHVKYEPCKLKRDNNTTVASVVLYAIDGTLVVVSLITWFADTLTDILVSFDYFGSGDTKWGTLTLVLVFVPSVIIQLFSARWYHADGKMTGCYPLIIHVFLMQPLERYLFVLVAGWRAFKSQEAADIESYYHQQNDVCMLRLFEAFLESAPQLTLQVYIMVATKCASWLTAVSACMSLLALGWSVTAYNHALRKAYRAEYTIFWPSVILQTCWHIAMVASRVSALVLFTCLYKGWVFLLLGIHWIIMTAWVIVQDTDFSANIFEERFFNAVAGVIYCFCFFSLKEGATRWRMTFFYGLMLLESVILMAIWYPMKEAKQWFDHALFITVFAAFLFGLFCMLLYYRFCHPSGPIYCFPEPSECSADDYKPDPLESPMPPKRTVSAGLMKMDGFARLSTASFFPRRSMLMKSQSKVQVEYKEVATPSRLTPIKDGSPLRPSTPYDQTFQMVDTPGFHHYSVNASDCLEEPSLCKTLEGTAIDLSCVTPQLRNKNFVPRNILQNELIDQALAQLLVDDQIDGHSNCLTSAGDSQTSIITPSGYLGSPEDKAVMSKDVNRENICTTPKDSPLLNGRFSFGQRAMISTPQRADNVPRFPLPDFTPIHPSVTPYLRSSQPNNADFHYGSFADIQDCDSPIEGKCQDEASLNVSQYDSFQTCDGDVSYYYDADEMKYPTPQTSEENRSRKTVETPEPATTTDTELVTTDSEYTSCTDTGYATSNC